jgi:hypothetical protein
MPQETMSGEVRAKRSQYCQHYTVAESNWKALVWIFCSKGRKLETISRNIGIWIKALQSFLLTLAKSLMDDSESLQRASYSM